MGFHRPVLDFLFGGDFMVELIVPYSLLYGERSQRYYVRYLADQDYYLFWFGDDVAAMCFRIVQNVLRLYEGDKHVL